MQFLICEGCHQRGKPCIAIDQGIGIDQTGYPTTCLFDNDGKLFGNKKWNHVDAGDLALCYILKGIKILTGA